MRSCPQCRQSYDDGVTRCAQCNVNLVPSPAAASFRPATSTAVRHDDPGDLVVVLRAASAFELEIPKSILETNGILAMIDRETANELYPGTHMDLNREGTKLLVPQSDVEQAKRLLCEYQVQCEIPADAVDRVITRVVMPSLGGSSDVDDARLLELLQSQTKDFRVAVFERTASLEGGHEFLERLVVTAVKAKEVDEDVRRDLATVVSRFDRASISDVLGELFGASPDPEVRIRVARTLGRLRDRRSAERLVGLLGDAAQEVRDEAFDGLFFRSGGRSFGYDPEAPDGARAAAIDRWTRWAGGL
ncbi:MAG: HEAT repeat domain-containing protein [Planctomycetes bacterium]|nr:HEAT repeat domain-containing protein [Planctomycetota bacterium]MBI3846322.1 HEAT repeat domain-containing protein [Planctomycetota bacterium]